MKFVLMLILFGHGRSAVPVIHSVEMANSSVCDIAKKELIADLQKSYLAREEEKQVAALRKSDSY